MAAAVATVGSPPPGFVSNESVVNVLSSTKAGNAALKPQPPTAMRSLPSLSSFLMEPQAIDQKQDLAPGEPPAVTAAASVSTPMPTPALVDAIRDCLHLVASQSSHPTAAATASTATSLLDELLSRWKTSTTRALDAVAKLEDECRAQSQQLSEKVSELARVQAALDDALSQLTSLQTKADTNDDVAELRRAVKEGMQSDSVRRFFDRLDSTPTHGISTPRGRSSSLPASLEAEMAGLLGTPTLPSSFPDDVTAPPLRPRSMSATDFTVGLADDGSGKRIATGVSPKPSEPLSTAPAASQPQPQPAAQASTAAKGNASPQLPRQPRYTWATKVFDLSFHEGQHKASTVADLRAAILHLKDPDITAAEHAVPGFRDMLRLRDTTGASDGVSAAKELTDDTLTLPAAGVGCKCLLEVKYPVPVVLPPPAALPPPKSRSLPGTPRARGSNGNGHSPLLGAGVGPTVILGQPLTRRTGVVKGKSTVESAATGKPPTSGTPAKTGTDGSEVKSAVKGPSPTAASDSLDDLLRLPAIPPIRPGESVIQRALEMYRATQATSATSVPLVPAT